VDEAEVSFPWAKGVLPGGDAEHALTADSATEALAAQDVACTGCVQLKEVDAAVLDAKNATFDDTKAKLGASTVQGAVEKVAALASGAGSFQEGNGTVIPYMQQWGLPSYGKAVSYLHLMNPAIPKVLAYLYGSESTSFSTSNNLVVAYDFAPNKYSPVTIGTKGQAVLDVANPSTFAYGNHILIHQTVGTGGNGSGAGSWELNQVVGVQGNTLLLAKALENSYSSGGCNSGQAQAVVAASYNLLEVVSGGQVRPNQGLAGSGDQGGILYVRARKVIVKSGGTITADGYGFAGGNWYGCSPNQSERGHSECNSCEDTNNRGASANCSGGGGADHVCHWPMKGGAGGGGNKTAGGNGTGSQGAQGGTAKGDAILGTLNFGGGGGCAVWGWNAPYGGAGGGIIVIGAETLIVEAGGKVTANGGKGGNDTYGDASGGGGGAGGTMALFVSQVVNEGTIEAKGGQGGTGAKGNGGAGGDGWVVTKQPIPGVVNESYPKGIEIWVDGNEVTPVVGDPNAVGFPSWDEGTKKWGGDGLTPWETGPLDLTAAASWTLGQHKVELRETGGAGGELKLYMYVIYPFTKSTAPANDTCDAPILLDLNGPKIVSGSTEDVMGKNKATDDSVGPFCGGSGGPDLMYAFTLADWRQLTIEVTSAFNPRVYVKKADCKDGEMVACGTKTTKTGSLEPGTYYLFVDSDGNEQKGDFILSVTPAAPGPPPNDTCAAPSALVFENKVAKASGMTLFATDNYKASCGGDKAPENVYQFIIPDNTSAVDLAVQADFASVMYLSKDTCTAAPIACVPGNSHSIGWPSPGTYFVFIDGKTAADKGLYTLTVELK